VIDVEAPASDAVTASPVWRVLTAAATDVCAEWPHTEHGATSAADVRTTVTALTENVRQALNGDPLSLVAFPAFVPIRRALELLRRAFLERSDSADVAASGVLEVIKAMERVQQLIDQDAAHRFAARLSGQDAQQLVVEMAHDMRSPLGSILILAERLRYGSGGTLTPIQERQLGLVYSAAFGLSALAGDVIELARGGTTLIDQQPLPFSVSDSVQAILDILRKHGAEDRVTLASFNTPTLVAIRRSGFPGETGLAQAEVGTLFTLPAVLWRQLPFTGNCAQVPLNVGPIRFDRATFIAKCHSLGLRVDFWTIDDREEAERLLSLGADGIMTNDPAALKVLFE